MITVVFGNINSGKSEYAESLLSDFDGSRYYLATMRVLDAKDEARVAAHRARREGKNFVTIEQDVAIVKAIDKIKWMETLLSVGDKKRAVLLECIPTLIANEMFLDDGEIVPADEVSKTVLFGLAFLKEFFDDIVIVSSEDADLSQIKSVGIKIGEGAEPIDESFENRAADEYKKALSDINSAIQRFSDRIENL